MAIDWDNIEIKQVEPWDPVAEGFCGVCGGEGQIALFKWTPFGQLPLPPEECSACGGSGLVDPIQKEA